MELSAEFTNRILWSDSSQIVRHLPKSSIDLIITDPPYGDNIGYGPKNIRIDGNEHSLMALSVMSDAYRALKANSTAYMFCGMRHLPFIRSFFVHYTPYRLKEILIWDKVSIGLGAGFRKQYECILVLEKGRPKYRNPRLRNLLSYRRVRDPAHPHIKPLALIKSLIEHSSDVGQLVFDPFLGSGTTVIAAYELGRHYFGIEIDEQYCALATQRLKEAKQGTNIDMAAVA